MVAVFTEGLIGRYDHQERLTAMEAMEHAYFFPVIKVRSPCASLVVTCLPGPRAVILGEQSLPNSQRGSLLSHRLAWRCDAVCPAEHSVVSHSMLK